MFYIVEKSLSNEEMGMDSMRQLNSFGMAEITGFIITLLIITTSVSAITIVGTSYVNDKKSQINQQAILIQLDALTNSMDDLIYQGASGRSMNLQLGETTITSNDISERFIIYYSNYAFDYNGGERNFDFDIEKFT